MLPDEPAEDCHASRRTETIGERRLSALEQPRRRPVRADRTRRPRLSLNQRMPSQQSANATTAAVTARMGIVNQKYWYVEKTATDQLLTIWTPTDAAATPRMAANSTRLDSKREERGPKKHLQPEEIRRQ